MFLRCVCAALAGLFLANTLRQCKSEFAPTVTICVCIYILSVCIDGFNVIFDSVTKDMLPIDETLAKSVLKIVGISYLKNFVCGICNDYGQKSIAEKVDFAARIAEVSIVAPEIIKVYVYIIKLL